MAVALTITILAFALLFSVLRLLLVVALTILILAILALAIALVLTRLALLALAVALTIALILAILALTLASVLTRTAVAILLTALTGRSRLLINACHAKLFLLFSYKSFKLLELLGRYVRLTFLPVMLVEPKLLDVIFLELLVITGLHEHLHQLTEHVHAVHLAPLTVGGDNVVPDVGKLAVQLLVGFLLIFQATHKPSANARDLRGVQGKILFLCHLDGNGNEIR